MGDKHDFLLKKYLQLPDRLEAAIAGLDETGLDWKGKEGWSIRSYVHHTVEGELIWEVNLRAAAGCDGIEFPMAWYFSQGQDTWAERWAYDRRPVEAALALFRGSTCNLVAFLRCVPDAWDRSGRITWPGDQKETVLSVRDIVLTHLRHMDQHTADIRAIRELHKN
ncbi:MAG TPA: DinB family protein [Anaerolineales bacterium]|nr:DinB family protein [Anaerolineales bacterium]